jgi:hypothetical protein
MRQDFTSSFYCREPLGDLYCSRRLTRLPNQHLTYERDLTWVGDFQSVQCVLNGFKELRFMVSIMVDPQLLQVLILRIIAELLQSFPTFSVPDEKLEEDASKR